MPLRYAYLSVVLSLLGCSLTLETTHYRLTEDGSTQNDNVASSDGSPDFVPPTDAGAFDAGALDVSDVLGSDVVNDISRTDGPRMCQAASGCGTSELCCNGFCQPFGFACPGPDGGPRCSD